MSDTNIFSATRARKMAILRSRDMAQKQAKKPISIMSTGLPGPRFSPFGAPWTNEVTKGICIQVQRCSKPTHDHAAS